MEQRIENIEKGIARLEAGFAEFSEFMIFVKNQFERQEKILETVSGDVRDLKNRTGKIEETLGGIQQAFWFKSF